MHAQLRTGSSFTSPPTISASAHLGNGVFNVALATDPRCPAAQVVGANAGCRLNQFDFIQIQAKGERAGLFTKGTYEFLPPCKGRWVGLYAQQKVTSSVPRRRSMAAAPEPSGSAVPDSCSGS